MSGFDMAKHGDLWVVTWCGSFVANRNTREEAYALIEALRRAKNLMDLAGAR